MRTQDTYGWLEAALSHAVRIHVNAEKECSRHSLAMNAHVASKQRRLHHCKCAEVLLLRRCG